MASRHLEATQDAQIADSIGLDALPATAIARGAGSGSVEAADLVDRRTIPALESWLLA